MNGFTIFEAKNDPKSGGTNPIHNNVPPYMNLYYIIHLGNTLESYSTIPKPTTTATDTASTKESTDTTDTPDDSSPDGKISL